MFALMACGSTLLSTIRELQVQVSLQVLWQQIFTIFTILSRLVLSVLYHSHDPQVGSDGQLRLGQKKEVGQ